MKVLNLISFIKIVLLLSYTFFICILTFISGIIDRSFYLYFKIARLFAFGMLFIARIKLIITGLENISPNGTYVFVSNHASQFDIMTLQAAIPLRLSIFYKKELGYIPLFGWQLVVGPYLSIDRKNPKKAGKTILHAKEVMIKKHISVALFAEGTRTKNGLIQPFKRGAFNLAAKVNQPIIPVTIKGSFNILPKGAFKINKGVISVHFDKPISVEGISSRAQEIELMKNVQDIVVNNFDRME